MEGGYYQSARQRCEECMRTYGQKYEDFFWKVQNLCASLQPGHSILIDDYVQAGRREEFCDAVIMYECEQDYGDGNGLVYLSNDRQRVCRSTVPAPVREIKRNVWLADDSPKAKF
jgi:hypothetical protein